MATSLGFTYRLPPGDSESLLLVFILLLYFLSSPSSPLLPPCPHLLLPHGGLCLASQMYRQNLEWKQRPSSFWPLRKERNGQFGQLLPARPGAELWACMILHNLHSGPIGVHIISALQMGTPGLKGFRCQTQGHMLRSDS